MQMQSCPDCRTTPIWNSHFHRSNTKRLGASSCLLRSFNKYRTARITAPAPAIAGASLMIRKYTKHLPRWVDQMSVLPHTEVACILKGRCTSTNPNFNSSLSFLSLLDGSRQENSFIFSLIMMGGPLTSGLTKCYIQVRIF